MLLFAAGSRRPRPRPSRLCLCLAACVLGTQACTVAPEPPQAPRAVLQLSKRYDAPTASLDQRVAQQLFDEPVPNYTELKTLAGLAFVRDVIARALSTPDIDETARALDVQGSIAIHAPCPGWKPMAAAEDAETGYVDVLVGVDDSRVQRAFMGSVTACRFLANLGGERAKVQASMQLEVDLGRSVALGDPVPPILMSAMELSAELSVPLSHELSGEALAVLSDAISPDGLRLELDTADRALSLRIADDDLVETLIDLEPLDLGTSGTILLGFRDNGSFDLRGRDSAWTCGSDGSTACVRSD